MSGLRHKQVVISAVRTRLSCIQFFLLATAVTLGASLLSVAAIFLVSLAMRLLQIDNQEGDEFSLVEFFKDVPPYAILSHTWGTNGTEVTYQDLVAGTGYSKPVYEKIRACGRQSAKTGLGYFWVDTCCIDKTSSAELSEAINSMYRWYEEAVICIAYIEDASPHLPIWKWSNDNIRWFTRGWTLQELIAPREVEFFDVSWSSHGTRTQYATELSYITGIHLEAFERQNVWSRIQRRRVARDGREPVRSFSIAQRMSWAAKRTTTRPEDLAYCLLGFFDVNMPLLYGEGSTKAFIRLQEEIMKDSNDHSLFAWCRPEAFTDPLKPCSLLAESPSDFIQSHSLVPMQDPETNIPYAMTNRGLQISVQMAQIDQNLHLAILDCVDVHASQSGIDRIGQGTVIAIVLINFSGSRYGRVAVGCLEFEGVISCLSLGRDILKGKLYCMSKTIYVAKARSDVSCKYTWPQQPFFKLDSNIVSSRHLRFDMHI